MAFWGGTQRQTRKLLEVTVDRCYNLEDTEPFVTQYSCVLVYGGSMRRTRPCFGTVQLQQLLPDGYVDSTWTLQKTDGRPAGYIRLTLQFPTSSCRLERQKSYYTAPRMDSTAPLEADANQRPILHQLLPYDARPPPRPTQPNGTGPAALWSQFLPYGSPPSAAPASAYNPTIAPPAGYPLPQYPVYRPPPPGSGLSDIYSTAQMTHLTMLCRLNLRSFILCYLFISYSLMLFDLHIITFNYINVGAIKGSVCVTGKFHMKFKCDGVSSDVRLESDGFQLMYFCVREEYLRRLALINKFDCVVTKCLNFKAN